MPKNRLEFMKDEMYLESKNVAASIGVSEKLYSSWEAGEVEIDSDNLAKLAAFYNVREEFLLGMDFELGRPLETWSRGEKSDLENAQGERRKYLQYKYGDPVFTNDEFQKNRQSVLNKSSSIVAEGGELNKPAQKKPKTTLEE